MGLLQFVSDSDAETDGVWIDYGDFRVRLARAGGSNKKYMRALMKAAKPLRGRDQDFETLHRIERDLLADYLIKGWQTKVDGQWQDGIEPLEQFAAMEHNQHGLIQPARQYFKQILEALPDLSADLQQAASAQSTYRKELEEAAGN